MVSKVLQFWTGHWTDLEDPSLGFWLHLCSLSVPPRKALYVTTAPWPSCHNPQTSLTACGQSGTTGAGWSWPEFENPRSGASRVGGPLPLHSEVHSGDLSDIICLLGHLLLSPEGCGMCKMPRPFGDGILQI